MPPHLIFELLVQLAVVLFAARLLAELARVLKQPSVVGELVAGVLLGPIVFGNIAPHLQTEIFPPGEESFLVLEALSWVGMVLLLFLVGAETDVRDLARLGRPSFLVAIMGLMIPFAVGFGLGEMLPQELIPETTNRHIMSAFVATAFTISSMAVLAKILHDLGLSRRDVGAVTLGASVLDDTVGWMILAVIMSLADPKGGPISSQLVRTFISVVGFLAFARILVFPLLKRATHFVDDNFKTPGSDVALYSAFAFTFAAITDKLGIHAVFGAFIAGTLVRQVPRLQHEALERLEAVVGSVLSPIFFAFVGLKLQLSGTSGLGLAAIVLVLATLTKIFGCFLGGIMGGLRAKSALVVGAGLSARGGMGIVVAVVGLSAGILSPTLYSVLVIMAIGTSLIAPLLLRTFAKNLPLEEHERARLEAEAAERIFHLHAPKFLVPTGGGAKAKTAVAIAARFCRKEGATLTVTHAEDPAKPTAELSRHIDDLKQVASIEGTSLVIAHRQSAETAATVIAEAKGKDVLMIAASDAASLQEPVVTQLMLESPCNTVVLCTKADAAPNAGHYRRVMVAADGSVFSRAALEFALAFAKIESAQVELVHVVSPALDASQAGRGPNVVRYLAGEEADAVKKTLETSLASVLKEAPGPVTIHAMRGPDSVRALSAHAQGGNYDLIIAGAERQANRVQLFTGHATDALLASGCSVAIVIPKL